MNGLAEKRVVSALSVLFDFHVLLFTLVTQSAEVMKREGTLSLRKDTFMGTPSGMRCMTVALENGDKVLLYSDSVHLFLQLRHCMPTEQDILAPSFKVAVPLTDSEALAVASHLLSVVANRLKTPSGREDEASG